MTYEAVEAQFHVVVRLLSDFDATNTSAGKYTILRDPHVSRQWVISRPGSILSRERVAVGGRVRTHWSLDFTLFHAFENTLDETIDAIRTARDSLITHLDAYPTLNSHAGVHDFFVEAADEPDYGSPSAGRNLWWQNFRSTFQEYVTVASAE
jgi:hypothetical protein|tara:strand:- start:6672 stop:7127 length:456 start_codon:yes stop_codon:yes gene_type:complete